MADVRRTPQERGKGTSLISTVCEGSEPRGHARKRSDASDLGANKSLFSDVPIMPNGKGPQNHLAKEVRDSWHQ